MCATSLRWSIQWQSPLARALQPQRGSRIQISRRRARNWMCISFHNPRPNPLRREKSLSKTQTRALWIKTRAACSEQTHTRLCEIIWWRTPMQRESNLSDRLQLCVLHFWNSPPRACCENRHIRRQPRSLSLKEDAVLLLRHFCCVLLMMRRLQGVFIDHEHDWNEPKLSPGCKSRTLGHRN
jgi:hypothetical protein